MLNNLCLSIFLLSEFGDIRLFKNVVIFEHN